MQLLEKPSSRNRTFVWRSAVVFGLGFGQCEADALTAFSSARFGDIEKSPQEFIPFPDGNETFPIFVQCEANISKKGQLEFLWCRLDSTRRRTLVNAIRRGLKKSKLTPAAVDGQTQDVWADFSILFVQDGSRRTITFFPNNQLESDKYGSDYVGAQRLLKESIPSDECDLWRDPRFPATTVADITAEGQAQRATFPKYGPDLNRCQKGIIDVLLASDYIPASYRGQFVASRYSECWQAVHIKSWKFWHR